MYIQKKIICIKAIEGFKPLPPYPGYATEHERSRKAVKVMFLDVKIWKTNKSVQITCKLFFNYTFSIIEMAMIQFFRKTVSSLIANAIVPSVR